MSRCIALRAYAKINWALDVLGPRQDGYHEIKTVMQPVSLHDDITVCTGPDGIMLSVKGQWSVPEDSQNICWRAAAAFQDRFRIPDGVRIGLTKHIPVSSGLGGGSSDCAAVLVGLARLYDIDDKKAIHGLAASLGSDTAFFVHGGPAMCTGRGEEVSQLECERAYDLVVASPRIPVSTTDAYGMLTGNDFTGGQHAERMAAALESGAVPSRLAPHLHNAFTKSVTDRFTEIKSFMATVRGCDILGVEMSGSGSALFGLAADARQALRAAADLRAQGYWACEVATLSHGVSIVQADNNA